MGEWLGRRAEELKEAKRRRDEEQRCLHEMQRGEEDALEKREWEKLVSDNKERLASLKAEEQMSKEAVKSMKVDGDKITLDVKTGLKQSKRGLTTREMPNPFVPNSAGVNVYSA